MPSVMSTVTEAPLRLVSLREAGTVPEMTAVTGSTIAVTVTVPVVAGPPAVKAPVSTVTLIEASTSKSVPSKARVSVAWVSEFRSTAEIVVPAGAPPRVKSPMTMVAS